MEDYTYLFKPINSAAELSHFKKISEKALNESYENQSVEKNFEKERQKHLKKHRNNVVAALCKIFSNFAILALCYFLLYKPFISSLHWLLQVFILIVSAVILLFMLNGINYEIDLFFDKKAEKLLLSDPDYWNMKQYYTEMLENTANDYNWLYGEWMNQVEQLRTDALQYGFTEWVSANSDSELIKIMLDKMPYELTTPHILMEKARIKATNDWIEIRTSMSNINEIFDDLKRKGYK